jgi:hypothetical protein
LKAIYRGRGISCSGHDLYRADQRSDWLAKLDEAAARFRAESLLEQLESLSQLRKQAKQRLLAQARIHADYRILINLPGFGPFRVAQLIAGGIRRADVRTGSIDNECRRSMTQDTPSTVGLAVRKNSGCQVR